jgi:glycosyltransferase involved in cell wall biosynthesis
LVRSGIRHARISVVPYFLGAGEIPRVATPLQLQDADRLPIILAPMRLTHEKGALLLPEIARALTGRAEVWVPGMGYLFNKLQAQARDVPNLRLLGTCDDACMQELYAAASVVIAPSLWPEPFGIVGLEAMAHGRPTVAFARGGITDWLDDGVTGLLVRRVTAKAFAASVLSLINDPGRAERLGAAGRQRIIAEYTAEPHLAALKRATADARTTFESDTTNAC